jgi:hypothetical protein
LTRHQRSAFEPLARGQSPPWRVKGNGSDEVTLQVFPHARYIDEVVGLRVKDQGRMYAHQAEGDQGGSLKDWNVTALTDLTGRVIEQYWYSPYGQLEAHVAAHPFDFDDDGDVDAQDIAAGTSGGTCWGDYDGASGDCKRLDADGDRDIDVDDYTIVNNYVAARHSEAALQRIPAASHSRRGNLFAHQGLPLDAELASYKNRARQYAPGAKRFMQRQETIVTFRLASARWSYSTCNSVISCQSSTQSSASAGEAENFEMCTEDKWPWDAPHRWIQWEEPPPDGQAGPPNQGSCGFYWPGWKCPDPAATTSTPRNCKELCNYGNDPGWHDEGLGLGAGSGEGKACANATGSEIADCLRDFDPGNYDVWWNNCWNGANAAAAACCLVDFCP